jgi:hypothetical protein
MNEVIHNIIDFRLFDDFGGQDFIKVHFTYDFEPCTMYIPQGLINIECHYGGWGTYNMEAQNLKNDNGRQAYTKSEWEFIYNLYEKSIGIEKTDILCRISTIPNNSPFCYEFISNGNKHTYFRKTKAKYMYRVANFLGVGNMNEFFHYQNSYNNQSSNFFINHFFSIADSLSEQGFAAGKRDNIITPSPSTIDTILKQIKNYGKK